MADDDWYRRNTWTDFDRAEFDDRLKRARKTNRPQYLRIQAYHLADAGSHEAALELLDRYFDVAENDIDLAQAWLQRAQSIAALQQVFAAIDAYRSALASERTRPNVNTTAWLDYPWFLVERQLADHYEEASNVLDEFYGETRLSFPIERYRYCAVKSLLAEYRGDRVAASAFARDALEASKATHSGFRYHPDIGLVKNTNPGIHDRLIALAVT